MPEIVDVHNFLMSIRETGYRSLAHAIAELVDNSLQAGASQVSICVTENDSGKIMVSDDGAGMAKDALSKALQFGGSTRFGNRTGTGRFGMGLPTSSVSLAKRVDVYTWNDETLLHTYLDLDQLQQSSRATLPEPRPVAPPRFLARTGRGTTVVLSRCDRTGPLGDPARLAQTRLELGRLFRFTLGEGVQILFNGEHLVPFDPLFLRRAEGELAALQYGPTLEYFLPVDGNSTVIKVRFSELPVAAWRNMSNPEKQQLGISRGAGVSIVRGDREIAYGWYFMGSKRRENYDDWWRCEVRFSPVADEYFGVNHTKQQISPRVDLDRLLTPDLANIARTLNARVRQEFVRSAKSKTTIASRVAAVHDRYLPPLQSAQTARSLQYCIEVDPGMVDNSFYRTELRESEIVIYLNSNHPMTPLYVAAKSGGAEAVELLEYLILAAARAELAGKNERARWWFRRFRAGWSDVLAKEGFNNCCSRCPS